MSSLWLYRKGIEFLALYNSIPFMSWQECGWSRRKSGAGSGRVAIFCCAWGCGFSGLVLKDSAGEPKSWGAAPRKRKERKQQHGRAQLSRVEPRLQLLWQQPLEQLLEPPSSPVPLPQSQAEKEGPLTCFRALSGPTRFCLAPVLPLFSVWVRKVKLQAFPTFCFCFCIYSMLPSTGPAIILPFSWKTTLDVVFGKYFCLFSSEYPFVSLLYALLLSLFCTLFY